MSEMLETLRDLPSPYEPHRATGLLHLPRFLAKIRKHLNGGLPKSYQRNFCRGFDGFLCTHLGVEPSEIVALVEAHGADAEALETALMAKLPSDCQAHVWNRKVVQMGMSEMGREALERAKASVGGGAREDLISFCDVIDFDEGRVE